MKYLKSTNGKILIFEEQSFLYINNTKQPEKPIIYLAIFWIVIATIGIYIKIEETDYVFLILYLILVIIWVFHLINIFIQNKRIYEDKYIDYNQVNHITIRKDKKKEMLILSIKKHNIVFKAKKVSDDLINYLNKKNISIKYEYS